MCFGTLPEQQVLDAVTLEDMLRRVIREELAASEASE